MRRRPPPPLLVALAEVVRARRAELGLTQENVGTLHRNYIGGFARLAEGLRLPATDLLDQVERRASELQADGASAA